MRICFQFVCVVSVLCALPLAAQEVGYLDLVGVKPRLQLRAPAPPPPVCDDTGCTVSGGVGGTAIGCGVGSPNDPRALKTTLMFLDRLSYNVGTAAELEIKIENAGRVAMEIPWSPHLADLQPGDETLPFSYSSLYISLLLQDSNGQVESFTILNLYGNGERSGTLLALQPGEWVRLRLQTVLAVPLDKLKDSNLWSANVSYGLRSETIIPNVKYGGYTTVIANLYPRQLSGAPLVVEIRKPEESTNSVSNNP